MALHKLPKPEYVASFKFCGQPVEVWQLFDLESGRWIYCMRLNCLSLGPGEGMRIRLRLGEDERELEGLVMGMRSRRYEDSWLDEFRKLPGIEEV